MHTNQELIASTEGIAAITTLFILGIGILSYYGIRNEAFRDKYVFDVDKILIDKQYYRLLSSGFLHGGWWHLAFNMYALYAFGQSVGNSLGLGNFFILYFGSKVLGGLLSLYVHRNHGDYRALGASGAISGVLFSYVLMTPTAKIGLIFLPIEFPAWLFGFLFILVSIYGIKKQSDNIGHEAHLGGAIVGLFLTILIEPAYFLMHWTTFFLLFVPFSIFLFLLIRRPEIMLMDGYFKYRKKRLRSEQQEKKQMSEAEELDYLLEKVQKYGINKLSHKEKRRLDELSGRL